MASLKEIINRKLSNLEVAPDNFERKVLTAQKEILGEALTLLSKFNVTKDGTIKITVSNLNRANKIVDIVSDVLTEGEYKVGLGDFAGKFDEQKALNNSYFKEIFGDTFVVKSEFNKMFTASRKSALELLKIDQVTNTIAAPLKKSLQAAVFVEQDFKDTVRQVREFIVGSDEVDGQFLRYAKRLSRDAFAVADRDYLTVLSNDLGVEWYQYIGGTVRDTRLFCKQRVGKYFHSNEIAVWGHSPPQWQGRNNATNDSTIFRLLGGWNCLHVVVPVSIDNIPKSVIERNINKGNFKRKKS